MRTPDHWEDDTAGRTRPELGDIGGPAMLVFQVALGALILLAWQGASGRLVDNFFISNPVDVGKRLVAWTADGSIFRHLLATLYATLAGFVIGSAIGVALGLWLGVS